MTNLCWRFATMWGQIEVKDYVRTTFKGLPVNVLRWRKLRWSDVMGDGVYQ